MTNIVGACARFCNNQIRLFCICTDIVRTFTFHKKHQVICSNIVSGENIAAVYVQVWSWYAWKHCRTWCWKARREHNVVIHCNIFLVKCSLRSNIVRGNAEHSYLFSSSCNKAIMISSTWNFPFVALCSSVWFSTDSLVMVQRNILCL